MVFFLVSGAPCVLSAVFLKGLCDLRFCLSGCLNETNPEQFRAKVISKSHLSCPGDKNGHKGK